MPEPTTLLVLAPAILAVLAIAALIADRLTRRPDFVVAGLIAGWVVLPLMAFGAGVLSGPVVTEEGIEVLSGPRLWLLRLGTVFTVGAILVCLIKASSLRLRVPRSVVPLLVGGGAFHGALQVRALLDGDLRASSVMIMSTLVCLALVPFIPSGTLMGIFKRIAVAAVVASFLAVLVEPAVFEPYSSSLLPGFPYRMTGIFGEANRLGPVALLYLVLEYFRPSSPRSRAILMPVVVTALILAQSKTTWMAAAFVLVICWAAQSRRRPGLRLMVVFASTLAVLTLLTLSSFDYETIVSDERIEKTQTLTGRTTIWARGFEAWRREPLFGSGPDVFERMAEEAGEAWAGQAHSAYVQALGTTGLIGLAGLLLYVGILIHSAYELREYTNYASMALVAMLVARSMSEASLHDLDFLHFAVLCLMFTWRFEFARSFAEASHGAALFDGVEQEERRNSPYVTRTGSRPLIDNR